MSQVLLCMPRLIFSNVRWIPKYCYRDSTSNPNTSWIHTRVYANEDTLLCEPLPCNPTAETSLNPWFGALKACLSMRLSFTPVVVTRHHVKAATHATHTHMQDSRHNGITAVTMQVGAPIDGCTLHSRKSASAHGMLKGSCCLPALQLFSGWMSRAPPESHPKAGLAVARGAWQRQRHSPLRATNRGLLARELRASLSSRTPGSRVARLRPSAPGRLPPPIAESGGRHGGSLGLVRCPWGLR